DMGKPLMIEYLPQRTKMTGFQTLSQLQTNMNTDALSLTKRKYRLRYVWELRQLAEKVRLFDAGLDDKLIEVYKFFLKVLDAARDNKIDFDGLYFHSLDINHDKMVFLYTKEGETYSFSTQNDTYRAISEQVGELQEDESRWLIIDQNYGKKTLFERLKERRFGTHRLGRCLTCASS
ncbi:MAG: hypothetical protein HC888_06490, partial [Candidatus Competibacteraceae bacterium]|nr:hypothetical protein [Candidatus Competibacteraceae bacterium]